MIQKPLQFEPCKLHRHTLVVHGHPRRSQDQPRQVTIKIFIDLEFVYFILVSQQIIYSFLVGLLRYVISYIFNIILQKNISQGSYNTDVHH
jgi:ABC-type bacteriocin/lantibiotic exporter with double-glycine peptidase domain